MALTLAALMDMAQRRDYGCLELVLSYSFEKVVIEPYFAQFPRLQVSRDEWEEFKALVDRHFEERWKARDVQE